MDANVETPRSLLPTILLTIFGSTIAGFLWIGRPGLAAFFFLATLSLGAAWAWYGFPAFAAGEWRPELIARLVMTVVSIGLVLVFRQPSRPRRWHSHWYFALLIGLAISGGVAVTIRSLLVQPFSSPSNSMAPTLVAGDRFFASKWAYGYSKVSFPLSLITFEGRRFSSLPQRGDVAVFRGDEADFVKRIVGLPGERIQLAGGVVLIDGHAAKQVEIGPAAPELGAEGAKIVRETLPNGVSYETLDTEPDSALDNTKEFLVPEGRYFVLGDNRDNSNDSRLDLGFVPFENLIGRAERIFWNSEGVSYADRQAVRPNL